jgi:plastocyanin
VQGTPGQRVTLQLTNDTSTPHNLSISEQQIDRALPATSKGSIEVTMPQAGVLLFFCKFHTASGMNGELIAGAGTPAAVDAPVASTPAAGTGEVGY